MINRQTFFYDVRIKLFGGRLGQRQVDGMNAILDEWEKRDLTDLRWLAYTLATAFWETAHTMWPIEEWGKGQGHPTACDSRGARYGRGFVQLTWKKNYATMGRLLGIDLVSHPEKALDLPVVTQILFEGMLRAKSRIGDFTGLALDDCFDATHDDWVRARAIVNGTDRRRSPTSVELSTRRSSRPRPATKGWRRKCCRPCSPTGVGCCRSSAS
jgi:hypothetical protein